jgi:PAS domain S-box-containing protein
MTKARQGTPRISVTDTALKMIMDASPVGILVFDHDAHVLYANALAEDIFGKSGKEGVELKCGDFISCANRHDCRRGCGFTKKCAACELNRAIHAIGDMTDDIQYLVGETFLNRKPENEALWVKFKTKALALEGRTVAVMAIENITDQKLSQMRLDHSHHLMKYIIANTRSAIAVHDRELRYVYVSQRYLEEYKVLEKDIIGKHHYEVFPGLPQKWKDVHQRALSGEVCSAEDDPYYREDGTVDWTRWECRPWYAADGSIGGIIIYTEVVTERKRTEEALRESANQLQEAQEIARMGRWELNHKNGHLEWSNGIFDLFEVCRQSFPASHEAFLSFVHPDDRNLVDAAYSESVKRKKTYEIEHRLQMQDGRIKWVNEIGRTEYDDFGKPLRSVGTVQDVTERRQAEEALRESEKKYRKIFETAPVGIFQNTPQGRFLSVNPEFARMAGYASPSEMIEQVSDIATQLYVRPAERDRYTELLQRNGQVKHYEIEFKRNDGSTFWASFNTKALRNPDGSIVYDGFLTDVTERVRAEQALRNAEALQRKMVANIGDVIVIIDKEGVNRYKSPNIEKWFGWKPEDVVGASTLENVHPEDKGFAKQILCSLLSTPNTTTTVECRYRCKDGSYKWIEFTGTNLLHDPDIQGILGNYHDITERKQEEQRQTESERYLKTILETTADGFWILDPRGNFVDVNEAYCRMSGHARDELLTLSIANIDAIETPEKTKKRIERIIANGSEIFETRHRRKDGTIFDVEMSVTYLNSRGGQFICFARDINERKRVEDALRENERDLRASQQIAHIGSWRLDVATNQVSWTEELYNMYGFDPALPPPPYTEHMKLFTPESWERLSTSLANTRETGVAYELELETVKKDGSSGWMWVRGEATRDSYGNIVGLWGAAQDITERKRAVEALQESEERFKTIIENLPGGVFTHDFDGRLLLVNEAASKKTGYPIQELLSLNVSDIDSGGYTRKDREKLWNSLSTGEALTIESSHTRKDRSEYPAEIHLNAVTLNKKPAILAIAFDISERKLSEEALRESEEKHRCLFNQSAEGIYLHDLEGYIMDVNHMACLQTGYSKEELLQQTVFDLTSTEPGSINLPKEQILSMWQQWQPGQIATVQAEHRRKDGTIFPVEVSIGSIHYKDRSLIQAIVKDISERMQTEAILRQFKSIFDTGNFGVVITDLDGQLTYVNEYFAKIHGCDAVALIGRNLRSFHSEAQRLQPMDLIQRLSEEDGFIAQEVDHCRVDGTTFPMLMTGKLVRDAKGEPQCIAATTIDISDRKALEAQLLQAQKMESIGRLAGGVAHDYNNMLSVIVGYTEMALERIQPDDSLHFDLAEVYKAAKRSTDITRQLLAFARKQTIAPKIIDLNSIVETMLRMLRHLIGEDIDLVWRPGKRLWSVKMDPTQVDQLLANLCVNARDAIAGVGKMTIETDNIIIDADYCEVHCGFAPGEFVMLIISDDGCGMDQETLQYIFEPFFTTKGAEAGTGLGLATVYGIVKQNAGFINVYSEPGRGTTFRIYLPRHIGETQHKQFSRKAATPVSHGETVLLVEDEPSIMRMGEIMLQRLGYNVLAAGTPQMAIDIVRDYAGEIDLLMTDVVMPEMNGRQLAEQLSALYPGLKTLFMSGYTANVIAHHGVLEEGMNFIQKPFSVHDLGSKIRTLLDGN